jgi:anti-anti-sigma factor
MQIAETGTEGVALASLEGRLDTATASAVEARLVALAEASRVVLDLTGVRFISSAGLRVLLRAAKAAKAAGRGIAVCALQPGVREVFEISGFDRIIPAYATRDEALSALRA